MKKLISLLVVITCFVLSCTRSDRTADLLIVKMNQDGSVDVSEKGTDRNLLQGLGASYINGAGEEFFSYAEDLEVSAAPVEDEMGNGTETVIKSLADQGKGEMVWRLRTFSGNSGLAVRLEIKNPGSEECRIERLCPVVASKSGAGLAFDKRNTIRYIDIDPQTWADKAMRVLDSAGVGRFVTGMATADGDGAVIGCISFDRFRGFFEMEDKRETEGVIGIKVFHRMDDHLILKPGNTLTSEWIYIDCISTIYDGLEQWAELTGRLNHAVISDPPAAGFYTWYYYRDRVTEQIMMDNLKLLDENRDRFPVNYIHLDWGWQRQFSSGDTAVNEKFPHGLRWLAGKISEKGFHPSVWVNPFMYTYPSADAVVHHPEIFMRDTAGHLTERPPIRNIMGESFGDAEYMIIDGITNLLDVSNPEAYDFLRNRYRWVSSMGYDMAMMDFVIMGQNDPNYGDVLKNTDLSTYEYVRKALTAAREGLGADKNMLGCGTIYEAVLGISNLTRISTDAPANWYCCKTACNDLLLQYYMNNTLWTNYADGLFVRDKISPHWIDHWWDAEGNEVPMYLTDDEAEFYTAVNGLTQAAVMFTEDITRLKENRQWLVSMVLPIYEGGKFRPVDLFHDTYARTLQLACVEGNRKWTVAAGLNWWDEEVETGLDMGLLDLEEGVNYHVYDVFGKKYRGVYGGDSKLGPVSTHGVLLVSLVPVLDRPQVVGTDLHISQGGVEIGNETWDENSRELTLELNDMNRRKGHIIIFVPSGYIYSGAETEIQNLDEGSLVKLPVMLDQEKSLTLKF